MVLGSPEGGTLRAFPVWVVGSAVGVVSRGMGEVAVLLAPPKRSSWSSTCFSVTGGQLSTTRFGGPTDFRGPLSRSQRAC